MRAFAFAIAIASLSLTSHAHAQSPNDPAIEACRTTGLMALKERSPSLKDLIFDMELLAVSKAKTTVEDIPVRTVIMGEAYLARKEIGQLPSLCVPDRRERQGGPDLLYGTISPARKRARLKRSQHFRNQPRSDPGIPQSLPGGALLETASALVHYGCCRGHDRPEAPQPRPGPRHLACVPGSCFEHPLPFE